MAYIEVKGLYHRFADNSFELNDINLMIDQGEFCVFAGKNGSGKTTFCKHLNGLMKPDAGSITINGLQVEKYPVKARGKVGMVFQNADAQMVGETVYRDIAFGPENLKLARSQISERIQQAIETTGLAGLEDRAPHTLSGGEKRKLAIAGVLAMAPDVLIFDEPFSNLDYPGAVQILRQILLLHRDNHTILLVTHDLEKVIAYASRLVIFDQGRVVREGRPEHVIDHVEFYGIRKPCSIKLGHGIQPWLA